MAQSIAEESTVCKFNQTGYCRYGGLCLKTQNNTLCSEKVCRKINCRERHPKTCRYFAQNKSFRLKDQCAYAHHLSKKETNIALIEREVILLKEEIEKLSIYRATVNVKLQKMISNEIQFEKQKNLVGNHRKQIKDLEVKVMKLEQNNTKKHSKVKYISYECDICDFLSTTVLMLKNHKNTKHVIENKSEFSMCEEKFDTYNVYTDHVNGII